MAIDKPNCLFRENTGTGNRNTFHVHIEAFAHQLRNVAFDDQWRGQSNEESTTSVAFQIRTDNDQHHDGLVKSVEWNMTCRLHICIRMHIVFHGHRFDS